MLFCSDEKRRLRALIAVDWWGFFVGSGCHDAGSSGSLLVERDRGPPDRIHSQHSPLLGL